VRRSDSCRIGSGPGPRRRHRAGAGRPGPARGGRLVQRQPGAPPGRAPYRWTVAGLDARGRTVVSVQRAFRVIG